ncbi:TraB/GumN family protein [Desulfonatronum parangueonense]
MPMPNELTPAQYEILLDEASVPEHSIHYMKAVSGGRPFLLNDYLFLHAEDWLLAVGYPVQRHNDSQNGADVFDQALHEARRATGATSCWAICPALPERLDLYRTNQDQYYILSAHSPIPPRLSRLADQAAARLTVDQGTAFTAAHRRLWAEFTGRVALPPAVRELYARTESVLPQCPDLFLLNAWDDQGNLAACLLLDLAPKQFLSYLLGAHSRQNYTPYASDLLFREMIRIARDRNKEYLHLGLGVNPGIRRFKKKWGAVAKTPYEMAEWSETPDFRDDLNDLMRTVVHMPNVQITREQYWDSLPPQRPYRLIWELEKNGRTSWIGGTAHFFCCSFESSMRRLYEKVDTVIFEGPLDQESLDHVARIGQTPDPDSPRLMEAMTEDEVRKLERVVNGPRGFWARLLGTEDPNPIDIRHYLADKRHWYAFFSLWTHFLRRNDWNHSVDLEAWHLAHDMGKEVRAMETIPEQIETLESVPVDRIVRFFRQCGLWKGFIRRNMRAYLKGDLEAMMGTSAEFPSRTDLVIDRRDALFLERMLPRVETGRCAVFVGSAHMFNLQNMLADAGFAVRKLRKI